RWRISSRPERMPFSTASRSLGLMIGPSTQRIGHLRSDLGRTRPAYGIGEFRRSRQLRDQDGHDRRQRMALGAARRRRWRWRPVARAGAPRFAAPGAARVLAAVAAWTRAHAAPPSTDHISVYWHSEIGRAHV